MFELGEQRISAVLRSHENVGVVQMIVSRQGERLQRHAGHGRDVVVQWKDRDRLAALVEDAVPSIVGATGKRRQIGSMPLPEVDVARIGTLRGEAPPVTLHVIEAGQSREQFEPKFSHRVPA